MSRPRLPRMIPLLLASPFVATLVGCAQPLLSPDETRSPFDRYDGIRSQYAPQQTEDEYGRLKPNMKGRLTPKD